MTLAFKKVSLGISFSQQRGGAVMTVSTVSLVITLFLMILVLAMQFQIGQVNRKIDRLLGLEAK
jgi:hypothetical protein